jgi:hypothetical protein
VQPEAGRLLEVHHREHPDKVGLHDVDDRIGKRPPEVPPDLRWTIDANEFRLSHDLCDESVDVAIKTLAEVGRILRLTIMPKAADKSPSASG